MSEKKMVNFTPRNRRILVEQPEAQVKFKKSGLHIPEHLQFKPNEGVIIAIDPAVDTYKVGDNILFHNGAGFELSVNGKDLLMINELEVFMSYEVK